MSLPRGGPVFLERRRYRRRRLGDVARLLPVLGAIGLAVPLLWTRDTTSTSGALLYLFGLWALLILAAWALGRTLERLRRELDETAD